MRRSWGVLTAALACALWAAPAAQAADACPNAGFREGAGASLPDCRAWEQVSPVAKNGNDVVTTSAIASVDGGDHVYFNAAGAFAGAESVLYDTAYVSARGANWSTRGADPPLTPTSLLVKATLGLSEDGTKAVVVTSLALAPGAIAGGSNLYVRDLTQPSSYRLVVATDTPGLYWDLTGFGGQGNYIGGNPDLSAIAFQSTTSLLPDAPEGVRSLYLWHDGRLSLASRLPDGTTPDLSYLPNTPARSGHRLSDDGTRLWFTVGSPPVIYQYVEGEGTTLISRSHRAGDDPDAPVTVGSERATADGRTLLFASAYPLTDASATGPGGSLRGAIYRWTDGRLTDLTAPYTPTGDGIIDMRLVGASDDGRRIFFTANIALTPDAVGTDARLYHLDTDSGTLRFVATFDRELGGPSEYRTSPDGRTVAFLSFSSVTGQDNANPACREPGYSGFDGLCGNVFTWSAAQPDEPVACLSCGPAGMTRQGPAATFGRSSTFFDGRGSRAVLDDGRVFFDSADRLVPADSNAVGDVYVHRPGSGLALLSPGTSADTASFGDISEDGRDVFFVTAERLVPQDADVLADLYTARVDGGIAAQQVAPRQPGEGCAGASCRPAPTPVPPASPVPGTAEYEAPDPFAEPDPEPRLRVRAPGARALRAAARSGRIVLPVQVSQAGMVHATLRGRFAGKAGRVAASATGKARRAGTVRLTLRLSRAARATLRRGQRLRLQLTVAFSADVPDQRRTLTIPGARQTKQNTKGGSR